MTAAWGLLVAAIIDITARHRKQWRKWPSVVLKVPAESH